MIHTRTHTQTHTYRTNSDDDVHELLLDLVAAVDARFARQATQDRKIPATHTFKDAFKDTFKEGRQRIERYLQHTFKEAFKDAFKDRFKPLYTPGSRARRQRIERYHSKFVTEA